ncbi:ABC transporter ATP-binding protein [Paenibacillus senegalensis]|uniref:ABC transporter ATP-binding protein n=1 Tax=Paenibacillus senegalensis TaxID=1465766 RepID=UPI000289FF64|nr:ABC transporter ATP-binding protein [Paenibacillus senegalensis]
MAKKPIVEVDGLAKSFTHKGRAEQVLADISLRVEQGEIVSLLGQSGCGKSTLLNLIGGFTVPDKGTIHVGGEPVRRPRISCQMLFQDYGLLPWRTVRANVDLGLLSLQLNASERQERIRRYLALVGLEDKGDWFPHQLSGGMKQRVALARALALQPSVLLMDEPFAALDTFNRYYLQDELLRIQEAEGTTVILVTHDIDEAVYLSDKVLIMEANPGRICKELAIPFMKPRDRGDGNFQHYRKLILEAFRLTGVLPAEEYSI